MTQEQTAQSEQTPEPNVLVERSPIILAGVAAAVALVVGLIGLPWEAFVIGNAALAWFSLGLAVLAMSSLARGQNNTRLIIALVLGIVGFVLWSMAPEVFAPLPTIAYLVTAVAYIGVGLLIGRMDIARRRSVYIACAGAVVFTFVTAAPRLGLGL